MEKTSEYGLVRRLTRPIRPKARAARTTPRPPERHPPRPLCFFAAPLLGVLLALPGPAYGQPAEPSRCVPDIGKEVVTQADILRHGFYRLSDVLTFSARWSAASLDGYHWRTAPAGFSGGAERWSLYIDDVPVAPRILGRNRLNALPVSLSDVACVEIISGADMAGPALLNGGVIRIYSKEPAFGLSMSAGIAAGNEINDPGPFRYTLPETINIDRIGPTHAASMSVGKKAWRGRASERLDEQHLMDAAVSDRTRLLYDIPDTKPHIRTRALGFAGAFGRQSRNQRILAGLAHTGDMAFFPETGLEIPAAHRIALWGAAGRLALPRSVAVRYAASTSRDAFSLRPNREDIDLDWTQRLFSAEADLRAGRLRLGGRAQAVRMETAQILRDDALFDLRLFGEIDLGSRPQEHTRLALEWARREKQYGAVAYASARRRAFRFAASYGTAFPDAGALWLWQRRGYALPYGTFEDIPNARPPLPRRAALDAGWIRRNTDGLSAGAFVFYRGFWREIGPGYAISRNDEESRFDTVTRLFEGASGHAQGVSATMAFRPLPALRQRISGTLEAVRRNDPGKRSGARAVFAESAPRLRLLFLTELAPASSFSLSTLVQYVSAMRRPEYEDAAPDAWRLPPRWLVNATAAKQMAGDRLNVSLGLRNMLNEPMRFHPAGAVFYMEFYFSVTARFASAAGF